MGLLPLDTPESAATLLLYLGEIDLHARDRGRAHQFGGRVTAFRRIDDKTLAATVRANQQLHETRLWRTTEGWMGACSCGHFSQCEHTAALAFEWLEQRRISREHPAPRPGPPAPFAPVRSPVAGTPPPERLSFRNQWESVLAAKLGRSLTHDEGLFLGKLSSVFHNFRQSGSVWAHDLARLGFASQEMTRGAYVRAFDGWWTSPPADPWELWQYVAFDIEQSGLTVPEFLRPLTDTSKVRAYLQDRVRRETVKRWVARFESLEAATPASPVTVSPEPDQIRPLELRLRLGDSAWYFESRSAPDQGWKEVPHRFLDRFLYGNHSAFADVEASPAVIAFLAVYSGYHKINYVADLEPGSPHGRALLHQLLSHRLARTLISNASGGPIVFAETPLTWRLTAAHNQPEDYELTLRMPDDAPLPPTAVHLPGNPNLYLYHGIVYRGPPALDGLSATGAIVPAEVIQRPRVLRTLRRFGTQLPETFVARFVSVRLQARFECSLDFDEDNDEIVTVRLTAHSADPRTEQLWTEGGWRLATPKSTPETGPGGVIYDYAFDLARLAVTRLIVLRTRFDSGRQAWIRRFNRSFPDEFLAWREALPPEVAVLASGELASLLGAPVRARVDFSVLENTVHRDWFDLALVLRPEDSTLTPDEIALLLKARGKLVRLPGKGWRRLTVDIDDASAGALESAGFDRRTIAEAALAGETHRFHALQLAQNAVTDLLPERQAAELRSRAREISQPAPPALPAGLRATLRPYQVEGFHFLAFLSANRLGGVLADDMGLGKTVQTLTWLLWLAARLPAGEVLRVLVVCPKSVVGNWEAEAAKFAPGLATIRFRPSGDQYPTAAGPHLVLANYTQLRLGAEYFTKQRWHAVILDEGQFIKTPSSKVAQVARDLPGDYRLVLTGTPIENRLLDLWSLYAFALPGLLGAQASFKRHYTQDNPLALTRLRGRVRHFLLRRTKAQVAADLPSRTEEDLVVELEGDQAKLYQAELKRARAELLKVQTARQFDQARFNILASLLRLRQICCHPALVDDAHREAPSAKLEELLERLEALRDEGHQVLVFSQFVTMLELIRGKLSAAGIEHLMLTGQTEHRDALVHQFQTEKHHTVFLLSLKAAGFGLNLTAASYAILYDPWWNPAVEAQAIDRTHRIGQTMPVTAYRLIARGTVEEKIRALQREKAALAGAIVQEESLASVLDLDSLRQILA